MAKRIPYVCLIGADGMTLVGPFKSDNAAFNWAESAAHGCDWSIMMTDEVTRNIAEFGELAIFTPESYTC